jgi:hypothetical protein
MVFFCYTLFIIVVSCRVISFAFVFFDFLILLVFFCRTLFIVVVSCRVVSFSFVFLAFLLLLVVRVSAY